MTKTRHVEVGNRFGRLLTIVPVAGHGRLARWRCRCDCGSDHTAVAGNLLTGHTKSCGCLQRDICARIGAASYPIHGMYATAEYRAWNNMKSRCLNPNANRYDRYGGRGISVCDLWLNSFEAFFAYIGPRPTPAHSIDRIDNDGNYEPGNVRWATRKEQSRNRRANRLVRYQGRMMPVAEAAELSGINASTVRVRLHHGESPTTVVR